MTRLIIESPYAGDVDTNVAFCRNICHFAVLNGYSPYASHLFFTQFLDDNDLDERKLGIDAGLAWSEGVKVVWFCHREGEPLSNGMQYAAKRHLAAKRTCLDCTFSHDGTQLLSSKDLK